MGGAGFADSIWRVATASGRIAQTAMSYRPTPAREESFTAELEGAIRQRNVAVSREAALIGASGHSYRATLFLPDADTVVEPLPGEGQWRHATGIYIEFGDLLRVNGYRAVTVVDDRERPVNEQVLSLLAQVGDLVPWSRRDAWLSDLGRS
jgi:hypothetical protein